MLKYLGCIPINPSGTQLTIKTTALQQNKKAICLLKNLSVKMKAKHVKN